MPSSYCYLLSSYIFSTYLPTYALRTKVFSYHYLHIRTYKLSDLYVVRQAIRVCLEPIYALLFSLPRLSVILSFLHHPSLRQDPYADGYQSNGR
jgi:hypothetical protein